MAKNKISEFSPVPANNTDIAGIDIAEGCAPSGINNAIRELMAQLKDQQAGTDGDNFAVGGNLSVTGTTTATGAITATGGVTGNLTGNVTGNVTGNLTGNVTGATTGAHNGSVGATTPSTIAATTISASGVATFSAGSAAAPSITTTGDTDTGIFFQTSPDHVNFAINGNQVCSIRPDGMGIGQYMDAGAAYLELGDDRIADGISFIDFHSSVGVDYDLRIFRASGTNGSASITNLGTGGFTLSASTEINLQTDSLKSLVVYNTPVTGRDVYVNSSGVIGYLASVKESKANITNLDSVDWLYNLNPVSFNFKIKNDDGTYSDNFESDLQYGLVAEEVETVSPELCFYDEVDGVSKLRGVSYSKLISPLVKAVQQQQAVIANLTARLEALEAK